MPTRKTRTQKQSSQTYDSMAEKLEACVIKLETGNLSLENAIKEYEEGVTLAAKCQELLDNAEQHIETLRSGNED